MNTSIIPDDFRFINGLHTTVRRLSVCTQLIKILGKHQYPREIVKSSIIIWSSDKEIHDENYRNSKGKITEKGKPTTAFEHYLNLCVEVKLINRFNQIYSNSRLSSLLEYFTKDESSPKESKKELNSTETLFYFLILFREDTDGLLLIFDILKEFENGLSQKEILNRFKDSLNVRLFAKQGTSNLKLNNALNKKLRAVNYTWQNADVYAEHLLIPRCEWLNELGLLSINKFGSKTIYKSNNHTRDFLNMIPKIENSEIYDFDEDWFYKYAVLAYSKSLEDAFIYKNFNEITESQQVELIVKNIEIAKNVVQTSSTNRVPVFDTLLFIVLIAFKTENIIVNFEELLILLRKGIHTDSREYLIKEQARKNEGYISILTK